MWVDGNDSQTKGQKAKGKTHKIKSKSVLLQKPILFKMR
jgi:hypothetical protein